MSLTPEEKVIAKIRKVLLADSVCAAKVATRVYPSHISTIVKPVYPAISLHLLPGTPFFAENGYIKVNIQIDAWLPRDSNATADCLALQGRFRALLHRQSLKDDTIDNLRGVAEETGIGPIMVDEDTNTLHIPTVYSVVAI